MSISTWLETSEEGRRFAATQRKKQEASRREILKEIQELEVERAKAAPMAAERVEKAQAKVDGAANQLKAAQAELWEANAGQLAVNSSLRVDSLRAKLRRLDPPPIIAETVKQLRDEHSELLRRPPNVEKRPTGKTRDIDGEPVFDVYSDSEARKARITGLGLAMREVEALSGEVAGTVEAQERIEHITANIPKVGSPVLVH